MNLPLLEEQNDARAAHGEGEEADDENPGQPSGIAKSSEESHRGVVIVFGHASSLRGWAVTLWLTADAKECTWIGAAAFLGRETRTDRCEFDEGLA